MNKKLFLLILFFIILLIIVSLIGWFFIFKPKFTTKAQFFCPVPRQYCNKAQVLTIDNKFFGIGYSLPLNTPVYSMFDGKLKTGSIGFFPKAGGGIYPIYNLTKNNNSFTITYISTDKKPFIEQAFARKQGILKLFGNNIASFSANLIIRAYKTTDNKTETIILDPKEFGYE